MLLAATAKEMDAPAGRFGMFALVVLAVTDIGAKDAPVSSLGVIVKDVTGPPRGAGGVQRTTALLALATAETLVGAFGTPAPAACQWLVTSEAGTTRP